MSDRVPKGVYEKELLRLQAELVVMQEWIKTSGNRLVVIFEGRDAAGKGGTIKRIAEYLDPRVTRIVALPAPTDRERTQWYFQRYVEHLPAAGEIVLFDRSWYNRAGVERVMGFCTNDEYHRFLHQAPIFERLLIEDGILLRKYWFSVSDAEQEARFRSRAERPATPLEALPDRHGVAGTVGGLLTGEGPDDRPHRQRRGALVDRRERRQAPRAPRHDPSPAQHHRLSGSGSRGSEDPQEAGVQGYERPPQDANAWSRTTWPPWSNRGETHDHQGHRAGAAELRSRDGRPRERHYRTVAWSGKYLQLTLMSIPVGEDVGLEAHPDTDQFLRLDAGRGRVQMGPAKDQLDFDREVEDGWAIFVPAGTWHNVTNIGDEPMQLYAVYAPVHHAAGKVQATADDAERDEESGEDEPPAWSVQPDDHASDKHA